MGWLNILGQVAGLSSTEFGLSNMIWAAVVMGKASNIILIVSLIYGFSNSNYQGENYQVTQGKVVGLFVGLLMFHGILVGTLASGRFLLVSE